MKKKLRNLIDAVNCYDPDIHETLHHELGEYLYGMKKAQPWNYHDRSRGHSFLPDGNARHARRDRLTGPPCPECGEDLRWVEDPPGIPDSAAIHAVPRKCLACGRLTDVEESFAKFDAVEAVLEKHLTSGRWVDASDAGDWAGPARAVLAEVIETSILIHWDNNPAAAEADFEDLRDYCLWQAMVDKARDGECTCDCHEAA